MVIYIISTGCVTIAIYDRPVCERYLEAASYFILFENFFLYSGSKFTMTDYMPPCALDYRYTCAELANARGRDVSTLYVIGGLYGNVWSLDALERLLLSEPDAEVVFNGDFNWFNIDDSAFARVNEYVLSWSAIRGNVETELFQHEERGCGCDYPDWVDPITVTRSNQIISVLRETAKRHADLTARLSELPRYGVYRIGESRVAVVHGDAESLSGWGFAQEHLSDPVHLDRVRQWFESSEIDVFACSHTCLPVMQRVRTTHRHGWIVNNGSAGMPNFSTGHFGLITRIGNCPVATVTPVYSGRHGSLYIEALPLHYDQDRWLVDFEKNWPPGSSAYLSYFDRIRLGPDYELQQAFRA